MLHFPFHNQSKSYILLEEIRHALCRRRNRKNGAIAVVTHRFCYDRTAVACAIRQSAIVREEYPLVSELHYGRVSGIGIACNLTYNSHISVRSANIVAHGISNLLWPLRRIGEVILAIMLMHPRSLGKLRHINLLDFAINLSHIVLQFGIVAMSVAPKDIRRAIIIDKDGRIDASPSMR